MFLFLCNYCAVFIEKKAKLYDYVITTLCNYYIMYYVITTNDGYINFLKILLQNYLVLLLNYYSIVLSSQSVDFITILCFVYNFTAIICCLYNLSTIHCFLYVI